MTTSGVDEGHWNVAFGGAGEPGVGSEERRAEGVREHRVEGIRGAEAIPHLVRDRKQRYEWVTVHRKKGRAPDDLRSVDGSDLAEPHEAADGREDLEVEVDRCRGPVGAEELRRSSRGRAIEEQRKRRGRVEDDQSASPSSRRASHRTSATELVMRKV